MGNSMALVVFTLKNKYRKAVAHRLHKDTWLGGKFSEGQLGIIACNLGNINFVGLFIEAQFHCMPIDFCKDKFKRTYPPANVCFGGRCWERYEEYKDRGIRDGS